MTAKKRALVVCPGRGSYRPDTMNYLSNRSPLAMQRVAACDAYRNALKQKTVTELDSAPKFKGQLHVAGENASLLTYACSVSDEADLNRSEFDVVGIMGNSMGFYTALALAGCLPFQESIRLVETMAQYQHKNIIGGQVMYPIVDEHWMPSPHHLEHISSVLDAAKQHGHQAYWSINLGSHAVLGADKKGLQFLMKNLSPLEVGSRTFPIQLPLHSAFHTPLMDATSKQAQQELGSLQFSAPEIPLIDGRGHVFRPKWADCEALKQYTLGTQVTEVYDFRKSLYSALTHCAPDVIIALGPGNALGGPLARTLVQSGWHGVQNAKDFSSVQKENPMLLAFGVSKQRALLI